MMKPTATRMGMLPVVLGALCLVAGLVFAVDSFMETSRTETRLRQRDKQHDALLDLQRRKARITATMALFNEIDVTEPADLETICRTACPDTPAKVSETVSVELGNDWLVHRRQVSFRNVQIAKALAVACEAEKQVPPWRLVGCDISALPGTAGHGRVRMQFEAITRAPDQPEDSADQR